MEIAANPVAVTAAATPQPPETSPPWHLLKQGKIQAPLALSGAARQRQKKRTPPEEIEADLIIMQRRLELIQTRDGHQACNIEALVLQREMDIKLNTKRW